MTKSDKNVDINKLREIMYAQKTKEARALKEDKIKIQQSSDIVLIEANGVPVKVVSHSAMQKLIQENSKLNQKIERAEMTIKKLSEALKKMDIDLTSVEEQLDNKADKFGDN